MGDEVSITTIPEEELRADLEDSRNDIALCEMALRLDIIKYPSGNVAERLNCNRQIVKAIEAELARRNRSTVEAQK